jgi:hypothetical protein
VSVDFLDHSLNGLLVMGALLFGWSGSVHAVPLNLNDPFTVDRFMEAGPVAGMDSYEKGD